MRREDHVFADCPVPFPSIRWRCKVIRAIDGDTCTVLVDRAWFDSTVMEIRYASIDAYELRGNFPPEHLARGKAAADANAALIDGKWALLVTQMSKEKYGRILGDLLVLGPSGALVDVSRELKNGGHAKARLPDTKTDTNVKP